MFPIEIEDADGDFIFFGEISVTDGDVMCGKGIRVWLKGDTKALLIGWFRNNVFSGYGRNIFERNLQHYEGMFFNYKYHGEGVINYGN
jgi:hypothetical protein